MHPNDFDLYRVVVRSHLGSVWMRPFPVVEFAITYDARNSPVTEIILQVTDQAELIGVLNELHGRGLDLLSLDFVSYHGART